MRSLSRSRCQFNPIAAAVDGADVLPLLLDAPPLPLPLLQLATRYYSIDEDNDDMQALDAGVVLPLLIAAPPLAPEDDDDKESVDGEAAQKAGGPDNRLRSTMMPLLLVAARQTKETQTSSLPGPSQRGRSSGPISRNVVPVATVHKVAAAHSPHPAARQSRDWDASPLTPPRTPMTPIKGRGQRRRSVAPPSVAPVVAKASGKQRSVAAPVIEKAKGKQRQGTPHR